MLVSPLFTGKTMPVALYFSARKPATDKSPDAYISRPASFAFTYSSKPAPQILNGKEVVLPTTAFITNISPDNSSPETAVPLRPAAMFGENDLSLITQAAQAGFVQHAKTTFAQRAVMLDKLANLLDAHKSNLARLMALEVAKPIDKAEAEVSRSVQLARSYAERCRELATKATQPRDMQNGHTVYQTLQPLGPVLAYTPFNFPLNLVMHKLAPAIGAGTSITIKPSPRCPLTSLYLGKLATAAGYKGISVVNLNNDQAKTLVQNPAFKIFSFTGAPGVGYMLKNVSAAEKNVLELGNNSALIVEDVKNKTQLKQIAERAALFKFTFAGQTCISIQRILVNQRLYPDFLKYFEEAVGKIKMGNVLDRDTVMGPMIDRAAADRAQQWVSEAIVGGAQLLGADQNPNRLQSPGWFKPTVLLNTTPEMKVNREEVFAPIATVTPYGNYKEALDSANDSRFALHTGVFTRSAKKAETARKLLHSPGVNINEVPTYRDDRLPYGGAKESGIGAEGSDVGIEDYSRTVYMDVNKTF